MEFPGEKLIIKLIDTVCDRGIASALRPGQIRREGLAHAQARRDERLMLEQAEADALAIQRGEKRFVVDGKSTLLLATNAEVSDGRAEPTFDLGVLLASGESRRQGNALREDINTAKTILQAADILQNDYSPVSDKDIEPDWLYRWRDGAAQVSTEEMQSVWAKVLAGEIKAPGTHSYRLLDFIKNLTREEAQEIACLCPYVLTGDFIAIYGEIAEEIKTDFGQKLRMQDLGLISGVGANYVKKFSGPAGGICTILATEEMAIMVISTDSNKELQIPMFKLTTLGAEVLRLNPMPAPSKYLEAVAEAVRAQGFDAAIMKVQKAPNPTAYPQTQPSV